MFYIWILFLYSFFPSHIGKFLGLWFFFSFLFLFLPAFVFFSSNFLQIFSLFVIISISFFPGEIFSTILYYYGYFYIEISITRKPVQLQASILACAASGIYFSLCSFRHQITTIEPVQLQAY